MLRQIDTRPSLHLFTAQASEADAHQPVHDPRTLGQEREFQIAQNRRRLINLMYENAGQIDELRKYERRLVELRTTPYYDRFAFAWKDASQKDETVIETPDTTPTFLSRIAEKAKKLLRPESLSNEEKTELYHGITIEVSHSGFNVEYDDPSQKQGDLKEGGIDNYIAAGDMNPGTLYGVIRQTIPFAYKNDAQDPTNPNRNPLAGQSLGEAIIVWDPSAVEPSTLHTVSEDL